MMSTTTCPTRLESRRLHRTLTMKPRAGDPVYWMSRSEDPGFPSPRHWHLWAGPNDARLVGDPEEFVKRSMSQQIQRRGNDADRKPPQEISVRLYIEKKSHRVFYLYLLEFGHVGGLCVHGRRVAAGRRRGFFSRSFFVSLCLSSLPVEL